MSMMIKEIAEVIRISFQTREFAPMVELFAENGIYETPYATENAKAEGIDAVRKRFAQVSDSTWNKNVKIEEVSVKITPADNGDTGFLEFTIKGKNIKDGTRFNFPSSVAIIHSQNGRIVQYQDYPNIAGIKKAAGLS